MLACDEMEIQYFFDSLLSNSNNNIIVLYYQYCRGVIIAYNSTIPTVKEGYLVLLLKDNTQTSNMPGQHLFHINLLARKNNTTHPHVHIIQRQFDGTENEANACFVL